MVTPATVTAIASAFPPPVGQAELWDGFFAVHYGDRRAARLSFLAAGIQERHAVVDPRDEDISRASTGSRMERYLAEAMPLGKEALSLALERSCLAADEVGLLAVVSCTGYVTPGIDVRLARDLSMSPDLKRIFIGHVGCHAALPAMEMVRHYVAAEQRAAVLLCLELPSLHLQPPSSALQDVVVHSLFSDAASAAVIQPRAMHSGALAIIDGASVTDAAFADEMTWTITDFGFKMTLSRHVPEVLAEFVGPLVDRLLEANDLSRGAIGAWAVHPGGPRVLDVIAQRLGLAERDLEVSRTALAMHGNCSSATILIVLEELLAARNLAGGEYVVALAFGPGLTLFATLLQMT
jgi:predicted naringenin-chalcone synthase